MYNTDFQVPDSAGTATALFSGVKTRMAVLGIDNTVPFNRCDSDLLEKAKVKSLLHKAVDDGKATGIISTTRVTHATPGALYAHVQNRDWEADIDIPSEFREQGCDDIAKQLVYSEIGQKVNLVFGGGRKKFLTRLASQNIQYGGYVVVMEGSDSSLFNVRELYAPLKLSNF